MRRLRFQWDGCPLWWYSWPIVEPTLVTILRLVIDKSLFACRMAGPTTTRAARTFPARRWVSIFALGVALAGCFFLTGCGGFLGIGSQSPMNACHDTANTQVSLLKSLGIEASIYSYTAGKVLNLVTTSSPGQYLLCAYVLDRSGRPNDSDTVQLEVIPVKGNSAIVQSEMNGAYATGQPFSASGIDPNLVSSVESQTGADQLRNVCSSEVICGGVMGGTTSGTALWEAIARGGDDVDVALARAVQKTATLGLTFSFMQQIHYSGGTVKAYPTPPPA